MVTKEVYFAYLHEDLMCPTITFKRNIKELSDRFTKVEKIKVPLIIAKDQQRLRVRVPPVIPVVETVRYIRKGCKRRQGYENKMI